MIKGNLYERNGIYYAVISYYENGKRKQKSVSTKLPVKGNKRKAIEFLENLKQEYEKKEQMENLEGDGILFVDFMEEWFKTIRPTIERATYGSYEQLYKSRIKPHFEKLNLAISEVKPQHIQALYDEILNESCGLGDKAQEKPAHCAVLCERGNGCPAGNGEGRPNLRPDFAGGILWLTAERGAWPALECGGF